MRRLCLQRLATNQHNHLQIFMGRLDHLLAAQLYDAELLEPLQVLAVLPAGQPARAHLVIACATNMVRQQQGSMHRDRYTKDMHS
jgi:hypothetical protein